MNIRVTSQMQANDVILNMQQQSARLAKYQNQVSSGFRVSQPSDDPFAFAEASHAQASSDNLTAYSQTNTDASSTLNSAVSALTSVNNILVQAKQLAQEANNSTTNSNPTELAAIANQVSGLITQALSVANSQPDGNSLFAGSAITTVPFSVATTNAAGQPETIAYNGATQASSALVGPGQTVDTRYAGNAVFQQSGGDVFKALISLRDNLQNTALTGSAQSQAFAQNLTDMSNALSAIGNVTAQQSSSLATLQAVQNLNTNLKTSVDEQIGTLKGTDYADATVKMQEQQTSLQATYATAYQLFQTSLLNFIH